MAPLPGTNDVLTFWYSITTFCMAPVTIIKNLLFWPIDFVMWVLVDIIAANEYQWLGVGYLNKFDGVKTVTTYIKEFRAVLIDHFRWPKHKKKVPAGKSSCNNCKNPSKFWCVECKGKFCSQCTY